MRFYNVIGTMLSRVAYFLSAMLICYASFFFYPRWKQQATEATISYDVSGYYWYLPSVFIYKDLKHQSFKDSVLTQYGPTGNDFQQGMLLDNGNYVMKYSSGMAIMFLPFFLVAHFLAALSGFPSDGFSAPYQLSIQLGGVLMVLLGLWYMRRFLLYYYTDKVVAIVLLLLVFGTNYLNTAGIDAGMSHGWLFTIYVFLLLNTHYFYQQFQLKYAIRVGLLVGLAILTRPTDAISCLIPLLWGINFISLSVIKQRLQLLRQQYTKLLLAVVCAFLIVSVQLVYWKYVSGSWLVYSYKGQEFTWLHPHIVDYTFSYRSGWLLYCPIMIFALLGFLPFAFKGKNVIMVICFSLLNFYIVSAWDVWWYGGRAMVQSYPILMIPMASFIAAILQPKKLIWLLMPIFVVLIYFNMWLVFQYHKGGLYGGDYTTKSYFWRVVGRWSAPEQTLVLRDTTELFEHVKKDEQLIYQNDFTTDTAGNLFTDSSSGITYLQLDKQYQYSPIYTLNYNGGNASWLHASATFACSLKEWDEWRMTRFIVRLININKSKDERVVKMNWIKVYRLIDAGETKQIGLDIKLPKEKFNAIEVLFWNGNGDKEIRISQLKISQFNE